MATKLSGAPSSTNSPQPFFVVCGPSPEARQKLPKLRKFLRQHLGSLLILTAFVLFSVGSWWAMKGFPGLDGLAYWGCEILAGTLSLLVVQLYGTFRRWGQERALRARVQHLHNEEPNALFCTPPPLETLGDGCLTQQEMVAITIQQWRSHVPTQLSEDYLQRVQLPDEVLAPDALVLQVERKETK